ncbi:MAG: hypothetical protein AABW72_01775 [archaeon]
MQGLMNVRVAGQQIQLIKLMGAFVIFAAILMFFMAAAEMFEYWGNIKTIDSCLGIAKGDVDFFKECKTMAFEAFGVFVKPDQSALNGKQLYIVLIKPVASLFIWIAILILGFIIYGLPSKVMVPVKKDFKVKK